MKKVPTFQSQIYLNFKSSYVVIQPFVTRDHSKYY